MSSLEDDARRPKTTSNTRPGGKSGISKVPGRPADEDPTGLLRPTTHPRTSTEQSDHSGREAATQLQRHRQVGIQRRRDEPANNTGREFTHPDNQADPRRNRMTQLRSREQTGTSASDDESDDPLTGGPLASRPRSKRTRSDVSDIDLLETDEEQPYKLVLRDDNEIQTEFSYVEFGRKYVRCIDLFENIKEVLTAGYQSHSTRTITIPRALNTDGELDRTEMENEEERQRHLLAIYRRLLEFKPSLHAELRSRMAGGDKDCIKTIGAEIEKGFSSTRGTDIHGIVTSIWSWLPNGILVQDKKDRGFRNEITARLLMPSTERYTDEQYEAFRTHERELDATMVPRFCHDQDKVNSNKNINKFFGRYLRLASVHILLGPSAVDARPSSMGRQTKSSKGTKRGNAAKIGIRSMTVPLLAYIATIVYYSLSDVQNWDPAPASFPLKRFYCAMIRRIEDAEPNVKRGILDRWNSFLWPGAREDNDNNAGDWDILLADDDYEYGTGDTSSRSHTVPPSPTLSRSEAATSRRGSTSSVQVTQGDSSGDPGSGNGQEELGAGTHRHGGASGSGDDDNSGNN